MYLSIYLDIFIRINEADEFVVVVVVVVIVNILSPNPSIYPLLSRD